MTQFTIQQIFDQALRHHQAGRLREAKQLYEQVLVQQPEHPVAMHHLGLIALHAGRNDVATDLIRRAIALRPSYAEAHNSLGILLAGKGELNEAITAFRQAVILKPDDAGAYSNLGNVLKDKGQLDEAINAHRRAIALRPNLPEAHSNLGIALMDKGERDEAIALLRQAIVLRPSYAEAHYNLGIALREKGELSNAITANRQAIALRPGYVEAHYNLGIALRNNGQLNEAIAAYRRAIELRPNFPEAYDNLGITLKDAGQLDDAIAAFRRAIDLLPGFAEAHSNLGNALREKGLLDEATAAYRQAIALRPNYAQAHSNLGLILEDRGKTDESIATFRQAVALNPNLPEVHNNLGDALRNRGQLDDAIAACRDAIALNPNIPESHFNLSLALLTGGDFGRGWEEHEWRWKCRDFQSPQRNFTQPHWDGSPLEGRIILLHAEQGFGDAIQFIRYLPLVAGRGGKIIIECQAQLQKLFQAIAQECQTVARGEPLPAFDVHSPLLSLPRIFRTTLANIPGTAPYLRADARDVEKWQRRLGDLSSMTKVGLVWAGSSTHKNDRNRSMKLAHLITLGQISGVRLFSLQKGDAAIQAKNPPAGVELVDWTDELKDFADTAALIANLDLIIAVDTSLAHLAGAMGKPVWMLLPFVPDWRWLLEREDSPWYPSMRLFRQPCRGDWESVIRRMAEELPVWMKNRL